MDEEADKKLKFLFFGELPPAVVHGVSISNKINTDILAELGELHIIEEKWSLKDHERFAFTKIGSMFQSVFRIWQTSFKKSPTIFYSVLYVSVFGGFKNLLGILAVIMGNRKTKLLLHVHRSDLKEVIANVFFYRLLIRFFNRVGVTFIVLSETQKEEVEGYLEKVEVLYNAIDEEEIYPIEQSESDSVIRFLYISNYIREKGILDLLKAFIDLKITGKRLQLDCYGGFTDMATKEEIERLTKGFDNIKINKAVYGEEKNRVLNRADIVVLPSYNEGLPLVLLESLRLKKPVIVSKVGYISEIFGVEYPLYCSPGDINSIKQNLIKAIELESNLELQNSLDKIYNQYSLKNHTIAFESIINDVVA